MRGQGSFLECRLLCRIESVGRQELSFEASDYLHVWHVWIDLLDLVLCEFEFGSLYIARKHLTDIAVTFSISYNLSAISRMND